MMILGNTRKVKMIAWGLVAGTFLHGGNGELEPMEVSALRIETSPKNVTARVQVIDQEKIEQSGATDLVRLLRKEANLLVRSTSGNSARASVSMGGFGDNAEHRTLILLDGHRLNAFDLSPINWHSIPLAMIKSIEVIRGAHSGTYGNHSVGGVIKINTKLPNRKPSGSLEVSAGSFDSFNARGAYSQRLGEMGLTIFGERAESDGYRMNGDHRTDAGGLRLDWGSTSGLRGYLSWSLSNSGFGLPGDLNASALAIDRSQAKVANANDRGEDKSSHGRFGLTCEIIDNWSLENRFGFEDRIARADMPSQSGYLANADYKTFSYSPVLHHNSDELNYLLGFDYFRGDVDLNGNYTAYNGDASRDYKRTTSAFFTSIRYSISEKWDWIGNLRYQRGENELAYAGTKLRDVNDDDWAGGIGLVRKFEGESRLYTTARRFFRYPSTDELVTFGSSFPWPPINHPTLVPENGYEVEFGFDLNREKISLSGRIFRQWMEQEIIFNNASFQNVNLDDTSRLGLDLSLIWQLADYASTGLSYELVRAEIEEGNFKNSKIPLVPQSLVRLFMELQPFESLLFNVGSSYVGGCFVGNDLSNNDDKLEDYWLFDLGVNYEFSEGASLFGGIDNLMDEEYLSTAYGTALYPGEGRKTTVGLRFSF